MSSIVVVVGVISGLLLGAVTGTLVGAGALSIAGLGPMLAAGSIATVLQLGGLGAVAGALVGGLCGLMLAMRRGGRARNQ